MPLIDAGYLMTGNAFIYIAPVGTAKPAATVEALEAPGSPWDILGHLGTEEGDGLPEWGLDGGEQTAKGSMSKKVIRTSTEAITRELTFSLTQFTRGVLKYYYGTDGGSTPGYFDVQGSEDGTPIESAMLITLRDGNSWVGFWAGRASISGGDSIDISDIENAAMVPLRAICLDPEEGDDPRFSWISPTLMALS